MNAPHQIATEFETKYWGTLYNVLSWEKLTDFWGKVDRSAGWYLYAVGQDIPQATASGDEVALFIQRVDDLLRQEHEEDYCGIVYADDISNPTFVKIYDPSNLGVSCCSSGEHVYPGWIMSQQIPVNLKPTVVPNNRKKWWSALFGA